MPKSLPKEFFLREPLEVARDLIGCNLVTNINSIRTSGMIIEAEAYGAFDLASHSYIGKTERNKIMFAEGGHCYVYFIYGMHYCVNVVTEAEGVGSAVLIRALEPIDGIQHMQSRRNTNAVKALCSGPSKLCKSMAIDKALNGESFLTSSKISLEANKEFAKNDLSFSKRIGISKAKDLPWRVFLKNSDFVQNR